MCNKNSPPPSDSDAHNQTNSSFMSVSMTTKKETSDSVITHKSQPRRRNRTKTRRPKFLSLRLQLSSKHDDGIAVMTRQNQLNQLDLFPLHPADDRDMHDEHNVALLFSSDAGATLNGLLEGDLTITTTTGVTTTTTTTSEEDSYSPPSMGCSPYQNEVEENAASSLVRKAMRRRNKEREAREERWVCYSEVVEKKEINMMTPTEEVSSSAATVSTTAFGSLSLKLDYQGILNAWSDKGPLYVAGEAPHTVPDLADDVLPNYVPCVNFIIPFFHSPFPISI